MKHLFFWTPRGGAPADPLDRRRTDWGVALVALALAALLAGLIALARQWSGARRAGPAIVLTPWTLPGCALLSLARVLVAYLLSLAFALSFAYWASRDAVAGRVFYPLVDHAKRAIPVLGLLPLLAVALLAVFPRSNAGLELAALLALVAGQFWPLTSALRHALRRVPLEWQEMAAAYRFSPWQRFRQIELPFALTDLVWGSVLAVARGWFLLMAAEALTVGPQDFRLPGLGSFLAEAVARGRYDAALWAVAVMTGIVVALDQLLWRPAVAWAGQFRADEGGQPVAASSWFLDRLRRSRLLRRLAKLAARVGDRLSARATRGPRPAVRQPGRWRLAWLSRSVLLVVAAVSVWGTWELAWLLRGVSLAEWVALAGAGLVTLGRVLLATALATLWAVPAGLAVGLSPLLSRHVQPTAQVLASFPAPLLFPLAVAGLLAAGVPLGWVSVLLLLLAAQWYVFFGVAAGASAIPADLCEMVRSYRFPARDRFRYLYLPAVAPHLVGGWDAASGAAWNASMVAEAVTFRGEAMRAWGLGAEISAATQAGDFARMAACLVVLLVVVGLLNREVWGRCYRLAEQRCALNR